MPRLFYSACFALHGRDFGHLATLTFLNMMQGELSPDEVVRLRDHLNGVVEDLKQRLERGESDLREKWRREGERLRERQEEEKKGIYTRQERDMAELRYSVINICSQLSSKLFYFTFQKQAPEGGERTYDEADEADVRDEAAPGEGARGDHHQTQELTGFATFRRQILVQKRGLCNT